MVITDFKDLAEYLTLSVYNESKKELHVYFTLPESVAVDARLLFQFLHNPQLKDERFLSGTITNPQLLVFMQNHRKAEAFSGS